MSHYFSNTDVESNLFTFKAKINNKDYTFYSDNGVFSKKGIDYGSRFLLATLPYNEMHGDILDVGCGYGVIGITIARETSATIDMIDINKRAVHLTKKNIDANNISNAGAFVSESYNSVQKKYNYIITNPPIRAGKKVIYEILFGAKERLKPDGSLWFVIRKSHGAKSVMSDMEKEYNLEVIDKSNGFFVIKATFS